MGERCEEVCDGGRVTCVCACVCVREGTEDQALLTKVACLGWTDYVSTLPEQRHIADAN